ncbi:MAG: hypothetical protein PHY12_00060 [Eubacteriales bacterium]|nr:hypothetical protein [Eubacteriales bacterium]
MKKLAAILLTLCGLSLLSCALADAWRFCDEMPQAVQALAAQRNPDEMYTDCLLLEGTPNGDVCLVLTPWWLEGYTFKDGGWLYDTDVTPMSRDGRALFYLRRHEAGAALGRAGAAGLRYADALGFDMIRGDSDDPDACDMMQFHWLGDGFELVGWQKASSDALAIWQDDRWAFFDKQTGERIGDARIKVYGMMGCWDELPGTYAEAKAMEAITRENVESLFDGWTLDYYTDNGSRHGSADYYRIDGSMLTIRHVSLNSDAGGVAWQYDSMPVPLSARLLERLQSEPFGTLIDVTGESETFKTADAFDQTAIPVTDKVLQSDLQSHGLMLLCENGDKTRYLCWVERQADGSYATRVTQPLPADTALDVFHCGDDAVSMAWQMQNQSCSFSRNADGSWTLGWYTNYDGTPGDEMYGTLYCGIRQYMVLGGTPGILVGSHPWDDLFSVDFSALPETVAEAAASLDRTGWAVVSSPDPADRPHLRVKPDRASESLGSFYNRTPARVLEQQGDWSHVVIGADGRLDGWMQTKFLTFGEAMDAVDDSSPQKVLIDTACEYKPPYASPALKETTGVLLVEGGWIAGAVDDELYVLLDCHGSTGYLPQSWFFDGNG